MKGRIISGITPQNKMVAVNNRFGNKNIAGQQGSTRVLFDSIELTGQTDFRFFENSAFKQYPFTNIGSEGNRLSVGETFVIQKIYFGIFSKGGMDPTRFQTILDAGFTTGQFKGELSFQIANSQVIKQLPFEDFVDPTLNPTAVSNLDVAFETFTDIVIPPLLEYIATVRLANGVTTTSGNYLVCFIEGSAGILAPQTTF